MISQWVSARVPRGAPVRLDWLNLITLRPLTLYHSVDKDIEQQSSCFLLPELSAGGSYPTELELQLKRRATKASERLINYI